VHLSLQLLWRQPQSQKLLHLGEPAHSCHLPFAAARTAVLLQQLVAGVLQKVVVVVVSRVTNLLPLVVATNHQLREDDTQLQLRGVALEILVIATGHKAQPPLANSCLQRFEDGLRVAIGKSKN